MARVFSRSVQEGTSPLCTLMGILTYFTGLLPSCCISLRHTRAYALSQVHTSSFRLTHGSWKAEDLDPDVHAHPHCLTLPEPRVSHVLHVCCKYFASTFLSYGKTVFFFSQNKQKNPTKTNHKHKKHLFLSCMLKRSEQPEDLLQKTINLAVKLR